MEQKGSELLFSEDDQQLARMPAFASVTDAARLRQKLRAQMTSVSDRMDELTTDPRRAV